MSSLVEQAWDARAYAPPDRQSILSLIESYYGDIETADGDFFDWQYFKNPSGSVTLWLAHCDGGRSLIGQHVLLPMRLLVDSRETAGALSFNALVDPRHHGKGIWTELGDRAHEEATARGTRLTYGIPNPNSHKPMVQKLAYEAVFDVPVLVKALDLGATVRHTVPGMLGRIASIPAALARPVLFPRARAASGSGEARQIARFDAAYDALADRNAGRFRILLKRDTDHLNWRYIDCPTREYRCFEVRDGERVLAYAVVRATPFRGLRLGVLLDFMTDGTAEGADAASTLLARVESEAAGFGCTLMLGFCLRHARECGLLLRSGWKVGPPRLLPQPFPLLVRKLDWNKHDPDPAVSENWFLTTGDYDVF